MPSGADGHPGIPTMRSPVLLLLTLLLSQVVPSWLDIRSVAAIERSEDITIGTLARYATVLGAHVEVRVVADDQHHFEVFA